MKQLTLRKHKNNREELKKELIEIRHNKNEVKRQDIRKTLSPSSRFLDNYYNSGMHGNVWRPNGKIITKKVYKYGEMGLSHFYGKNNVLEKLDVLEKKDKKKSGLEAKHFLEYDYIDEGDIVITIEHCSNCEDHATHTQHINEIYPKFAKVLQKCILLRYPYIKVYLKPIETDIIVREVCGSSTNRVGSNVIDNLYKEVRIGALEVQLAYKIGPNVEIKMIHSKLNSGNWPSISNVLNKIVKFIPIFNFDVKVYDKEHGIDKGYEENKNEEFLFSKYENIKINLYLLNHPQIGELANYITEELESIINPKKRKILLSQVRLMKKQSYQGSMSINNNQDMTNTGSIINQSTIKNQNISRINTARPSRSKQKMDFYSNQPRSETVRSSSSSRLYSPNPYSSSLMNQSVLRPMSVGSNGIIRSSLNISQNLNKSVLAQYYDAIEDKDKLNSFKGPLIFSKFTDKNGQILLQNLPYDIYLLEIEDSKNFLNSGSVVKFNKIPPNNQKDKALIIQKFYGLRRQTHAYTEIYIYHNLHENENELNLNNVSGAEVIIRRSTENLVENNFFGDENKLNLSENKKIKGRHETITIPGKYILEVSKKGYDYVRKEVELFPGENKINVELTKEKKVKICVSVFNYETKLPVENVNLQISYSKSDCPELGLTDSSGQFILETVKNDDYVTVFAIKDGFYCCQRSFVKDYPKSKVNNMRTKEGVTEREMIEKTWKISEKEDVEKDIYIYLVQERFVTQNENFLMILYSNIFDENFEHKFIIADEMKKLVSIKCEDHQRSKGMISYIFNKNENFKNFNFDEQLEDEDYPEVIRLIFQIKNKNLLKNYESNMKALINGLQKYSCEVTLFTPNGSVFFIGSPQFSRDEEYNFWDVGLLDIRSCLFYEMGLLVKNIMPKNSFFGEWLHFLQIIIDKKIYTNLFEFLQFNKGILSHNDRLVYEAAFIRAVKQIYSDEIKTIEAMGEHNNQNFNKFFSVDFLIYLCDLMKNPLKMVSYSLFKKKISSNLKNFKYEV